MGQDDHTCFATVFDANVAVIPLISSIAPLPGAHCSVVLILCPGDLFNASGQEKVPDTVRDSDAGSGLLAMSALIWVVRRFHLLTGNLRRIATRMDKPTVSGLKALRNEMVALIKKQVPLIWSGKIVVAANASDEDGEEVHSASVVVGVAPNVADARGKLGVGVDEADAAAGKGVTGTKVVHGNDDGVKDREEEREGEGSSEESSGSRSGSGSGSGSESESEEEQKQEQEMQEHERQHKEEQLVVVEDVEMAEVYVVGGAEETGGRSADVENDEGEGKGATADLGKVGVEAAHGGGGMVEVGEGDNAALSKQRGVDVHTDATAEKAGGERSRRKKAASDHPGSTTAGRQARLDVVDQLRAENRRLRADNARLERRLGEQTGRVDSLAAALAGLLEKVKGLTAQVADTDRKSEERLKEATLTMVTTITEGLTDNMDSAIQSAKSFAELARQMLLDLDDPKGRAAVTRATAVKTLTEHVTAEVGEARKGLEESFIKYIGAAQTNIAAA
ncbi:unnamed protein product [Closterium sp. NIES-65]|nr:unnamed protein product [Closterium sp. NIES-65]